MVVASTTELANDLCKQWARAGIKVQPKTKVKALGSWISCWKEEKFVCCKGQTKQVPGEVWKIPDAEEVGCLDGTTGSHRAEGFNLW